MKSLLIIAALLYAGSSAAQTAATPPVTGPTAPAATYGPPIALEEALDMIARGRDLAAARGWRLAFAVVEPSGELVAFARMDDTQYGSIHVAQRKATSAARYRISTAVVEARTMEGRVVTLANDDMLPIAGGLPIVSDGRVIGALGVSGATAAQDQEIAMAILGD